MAKRTFTDMEIEESRISTGVPEDWVWVLCYADCGDIVWVPPGIEWKFPAVRPVCSAECAMTLMQEGNDA
jgi:hypothetical protein